MFSRQSPSDGKTKRSDSEVGSTKFEDLEAINEYNKPCILVADENSEFTETLSKGLTKRGYSCYVTENKREVLSMFLLKRPVVTVLGLNIQEKEDGIKAASDILRTSSRAEIVVLTDSISEVTKTEKIGVELFVRKDAGLAKIINAICVASNLRKPSCKLVSK